MSSTTPDNPQHTALPWEACEHDGRALIDGANGFVCTLDQANADLIVRAVNAHDALVAALRWYRDEAQAIARGLNGKRVEQNPHAVEAPLTVLALDGGRRADAALALVEGPAP